MSHALERAHALMSWGSVAGVRACMTTTFSDRLSRRSPVHQARTPSYSMEDCFYHTWLWVSLRLWEYVRCSLHGIHAYTGRPVFGAPSG